MCTYTTEHAAITGAGKGARGWFDLATATVYYDHPVHAQAEHTLNIDFADPAQGPGARVAVELTADSALALVTAIQAALAAVPPEISGLTGAGAPSAAQPSAGAAAAGALTA